MRRQQLSIEICKARRRMRRALSEFLCQHAITNLRVQLALRKKRVDTLHRLTDHRSQDIVYNDPESMQNHITAYFAELFAEKAPCTLPGWVFQRWQAEFLRDLLDIDSELIKHMIFDMRLGKSCAEDFIVIEMLRELADDILQCIARAFQLRLLNHCSEDGDDAWDFLSVLLIRKKIAATTIKHFRPISIIPVLNKVYSKMLLFLCNPYLKELSAPQFACRKRHQAHEVIFTLRNLIEKQLEWRVHLFFS